MAQRLKASSFSHVSEFSAALDEIATLQVKLRILEAKRDKAIQLARDAHAKDIDAVSAQLKSTLALAEKFAESHRDEILPPGKKSSETALAIYGFRLGNPTLKPLNKRWTWGTILGAVRTRFQGRFIRTKEELDKDALKAQLSDEQLASVGCRIEQSEDFFIDAKEQATPTPSTTEAA